MPGPPHDVAYPDDVRRPLLAMSALLCGGLLAGCVGTPASAPSTPAAASAAPATPSAAPSPASPSAGAPAVATPSAPSPSDSPSPSPATSAAETTTSPSPVPSASAEPSATASASPRPSHRPTAVVPPPDTRPAVPMPANPIGMSPLTGRPIGAKKPVLVVKLDNTPNAQPHAGLIDADVVYIEEVEYGITRLAAVFSSQIPRRIGPVRSARITDIDLFAQYGKPAFGYSGAQRRMFPYLKAASIYDVSPYTSYTGYSRDAHRRVPYNLFFDGRAGIARAPKATPARDMGFVFDATMPPGGLNATKATMAWGYASAGFAYDKAGHEYRITLNGRPARAEEWSGGQRASTVVIQYVKQTKSQFWDKGGGNTPHAQTIGTGKAVVLRDGRAWKVAWHRPNARSGTTFTLPDGSLMTFRPGQLWIVLLDRKRTAAITPLTKPKAVPRPVATPTAAPGQPVAPSTSPTTPPASVTPSPSAGGSS
jgi:hypothetical protein